MQLSERHGVGRFSNRMILERENAMQGLPEQTFFPNVFPRNLKKLQNIPRKSTY